MKKIILLITTVILAQAVNAQAVASLRGGVTKNFSTGFPTFFGPGASFQYGLNENMALGFNFDYHIGENSQSWMNFEPRFDYYLNETFNGFHLGTNFAYTIYSLSITTTVFGVSTTATGSTGQMHLGANLGYTHPLSDNLLIDVSSGLGYTLISNNGSFGIRPAVSLGYKFGG